MGIVLQEDLMRRPIIKNVQRRELKAGDLELMRLPVSYWNVTRNDVPVSIQGVVDRYLAQALEFTEKGVGLAFVGSQGSGATNAAVYLAKELRSLGGTVTFMEVGELRELLRAGAEYNDELSMIERIRQVEVLVLAGFTVEDATARNFNLTEIAKIVCYRTMWARVTFLVLYGDDLAAKRPPYLDFIHTLLGSTVYVPVLEGDQGIGVNVEMRKKLGL